MKKFKIAMVTILTLCVLTFMCGCFSEVSDNSNSASNNPRFPNNSNSASNNPELPARYSSYREIYDNYAQRIKDETINLINEYYEEAKTNLDGISGLAEICNDKISELAEIANEGVEEMAEFYYKNSSGKYSEYQDWANELMDVYLDKSQEITDAYLDSIM